MLFYLVTALISALRIKLKHIYNKIKIRMGEGEGEKRLFLIEVRGPWKWYIKETLKPITQ